jgi:hypothetical protein
MTGAHAIEVWNGPWERFNPFSVAEWEERLLRGERFVAVGGSDAHIIRAEPDPGPSRRPRLGEPTIWVEIDGALTVEAVLASIRAGRCFLSVSPNGPQLYLRGDGTGVKVRVVGGGGGTLVLVGDAERLLAAPIDADDWRGEYAFHDGLSYLRAEVTGENETMLAFSNPIWRAS